MGTHQRAHSNGSNYARQQSMVQTEQCTSVEIARSYQSAYTIEQLTVRRIGTNHFHSSLKYYKKYQRSVDHTVILEVPIAHSKSSSGSSVKLPKNCRPKVKFNGHPICLCNTDVKYSNRIRIILIPVIVIVIIVIGVLKL